MNARSTCKDAVGIEQENRSPTGTQLVSPELLSRLTEVALALARCMADNDHEARVAALEKEEGKIPEGTKRPVGPRLRRISR